MDDTLAVRVRQPGQHLAQDEQGPPGGRRALLDQVAQGHAVHEVHDQVGHVGHAEIDDRDAVRMAEAAHRAGFDLETTLEFGLAQEGDVEELDRHRAPQLQAFAPVHRAHRARRDAGHDPVTFLQDGAEAWVLGVSILVGHFASQSMS